MTAAGDADRRGHPAPGSAVPGAPPPLRRALTPADGMRDTPSTGSARDTETLVAQPVSAPSPSRSGPRLLVAAAMLGVAVGLEIAGALARPQRRQMLT